MFVDKKSESLIRYLAENEPTKVDGKYIYPVSQLVSSFDSDQNHWSAEYLKPYLVTLQEQELVTSFDFPNRYSVHIEPTARLLHFDEYQSADKLSTKPGSNKNKPDAGVERPYLRFFRKAKEFLSVTSNLVTVIGGVVTFIYFLIAHFQ